MIILSFVFGGCIIFFVTYKMKNSSDSGREMYCKNVQDVITCWCLGKACPYQKRASTFSLYVSSVLPQHSDGQSGRYFHLLDVSGTLERFGEEIAGVGIKSILATWCEISNLVIKSEMYQLHFSRSQLVCFSCPDYTSHFLLSTVPPKISNISSDVTVNEGSNVTLVCMANGRPEPVITWRHLTPTGRQLARF